METNNRYPQEKVENYLREKRFSEALQICLQYFTNDCYDRNNKKYLARCMLESALHTFDGNLTPEFLDALLFSLRFGIVPDIAFSEVFSLYEKFLIERFEELRNRGKIIFVIGTGRNGSMTVASALSHLPNSLVTHECPPIVFWKNAQEQLRFHIKFMELSRRFFSYVIDVSHWWLPHLEKMQQSLGKFGVISLQRDYANTVNSFLKIKGMGLGTINHWTNHDGHYWTRHYWDECYPDVIDFSDIGESLSNAQIMSIQRDCVYKYVESYNAEAKEYVENHDGILFNLDNLFTDESKGRLYKFLGCEFDWQKQHLNIAGVQSSQQHSIFTERKLSSGTQISYWERNVKKIDANKQLEKANISLCLIVRNELDNLKKNITPLLESFPEVVIVDTGSDDGTREYLESLPKHVNVIDFIWIDDFSAARNQYLKAASSDWIYWMDADEYLNPKNIDVLKSCSEQSRNTAWCYRYGEYASESQIKLFPNIEGIRYEMRCHEQIRPSLLKAGVGVFRFFPSQFKIENPSYAKTPEESIQRNIKLLKLDIEERPDYLMSYVLLAYIYTESSAYDDALKILDQCLSQSIKAASIDMHGRRAAEHAKKVITLQKNCHEKVERGENLTHEELQAMLMLAKVDPY
jgi:glycosyltransferase involved in cell wall biosynthesis